MISNIIESLKENKLRLPIWLGQLISYYPYSYRPIVGKIYRTRMKEIKSYTNLSDKERQDFIFKRVHAITEYAIANIPFYKDYYRKHNFDISQLKTFDDIQRIPIINKHDLLEYPIELRSNMDAPKFLVNTGGSSGYTLSFYVQPSSIGNEKAHIHTMWSQIGYKPSDLRLYIAGRSAVKNGVDYEFARHTISIDMYKPFEETAPLLIKKIKHHPCYYLLGYPSVLSEFAEYCKTNQVLLNLLKSHLRGALLSSEFPYPVYRNPIENIFKIKTKSFYGHTERCVMAYETDEKFNFIPFQTYGYAEAIPNDNNHYDLIGTSYYNQASPLIRYNTKDIIDNPCIKNGILTSFNIFEGRSGQFILDKSGKKISLTGLMMGRHHPIFNYCSHIQIAQEKKGEATILYVPKQDGSIKNIEKLFDSSNVDITFDFKKIDKPIRTISGKVNLLVTKQ